MKKIKILTPLVTVAALSGTAMTIVSCGQTQNEKIVPAKLLSMEETTLKGLTDGADISQYNTLVIPETVRIVDIDAFNNSKIDYSSIKTLKFSKGIRQIKKNAFAGLKDLELIDFSNFDIDTITGLTIEQGAFGENQTQYCYVKLPANISNNLIAQLKNNLLTCGIPESWFVEKTEGHVEITSEKKDVKYDGIDPTKIETKLNKPIEANEKFEVSIKKTNGTDKVGIKLIGQPTYANQTLTYNVELSPDAGKTLTDGDYVEYKVTILNKTITSETNGETTNWVQVINNCKMTYKTPELYVTSIKATISQSSKIYHQDDFFKKEDVIVEAVNNDRSTFVLNYDSTGQNGYTVEDVADFNTGYQFTLDDIYNKPKSFTFKYSKKGVGEFTTSLAVNNLSLKVESISVTGANSITRGTNSIYSPEFLPAGSSTNIKWSVEPYIIGQSIEGISIDEKTGKVTVENQASTNPINIIATDVSDPTMEGKKTNVSIEIPAVDGITFDQTYPKPYRGIGGWLQTDSTLTNYTFKAHVNNPAAKQQVEYYITTDFTGKTPDESVTVNKDSGVVTIGKNVEYNKAVTIRAIAAGESPKTSPKNYEDFTFNVDIPNPTKVNITNTGSSTMKRVQETRTFTYSVEPEGAEQSVNWFTTNTSGKTVTGLSIDTNGVLSATDVVVKQNVNVYAKHKPIVKTGTTACTSENSTVSIVYPDIQTLSISSGPKTDPLQPTRYSIDRGTTATTAFTAELAPAGAYKDIRWTVSGVTAKDGTSINEKTGILTVGSDVSYTDKKFKVTATAYDENGVVKATDSVDVYYTIPAITDVTIKAVRTPTPKKSLTANTHDQGSTFTYSVASVTPAGAEKDVTFTFDPGQTEGVALDSQTSRQCVISATSNAKVGDNVNYGIKVTTVGKQSSGQPLEKDLSIKVVVPCFVNASLAKLNAVATDFENSDQDETAARAACAAFADITYIEGKSTVRESLFNFVTNNKMNICNQDCYVADVCRDKLENGKFALFTFISLAAINSPWTQGDDQYNTEANFADAYIYKTVLLGSSLYSKLKEQGCNRKIERNDIVKNGTSWELTTNYFEIFVPYVNEIYGYQDNLRLITSYTYHILTDNFKGKSLGTMTCYKTSSKEAYYLKVDGTNGQIYQISYGFKWKHSSYCWLPMFCI